MQNQTVRHFSIFENCFYPENAPFCDLREHITRDTAQSTRRTAGRGEQEISADSTPPLPFEIAGTDILKINISPLHIPAESAAVTKRRSKNIQTSGKARPEIAAVWKNVDTPPKERTAAVTKMGRFFAEKSAAEVVSKRQVRISERAGYFISSFKRARTEQQKMTVAHMVRQLFEAFSIDDTNIAERSGLLKGTDGEFTTGFFIRQTKAPASREERTQEA